MRYVNAKAQKESEAKAYRIYVTDGIKMISENTAKTGKASYFQKRYIEVIKPVPEETRTADEIIDGIRNKIQNLGG